MLEKELVEDLLVIVIFFVGKFYGVCFYKKKCFVEVVKNVFRDD